MSNLTHKDLCKLAVKWLQRPNSQKGHGCEIALSECTSGWDGECPDAIGFKLTMRGAESTVVEVKVSRSDFLSDKNKPHRNGSEVGLGRWRYYMCPEGIIKPEDLPPKFGLLYVNNRGHIKHIVSPFVTKDWRDVSDWMTGNTHESNHGREVFLLARILRRFPDLETFNEKYKEISRHNASLVKTIESQREKIRSISWRNMGEAV